MVIYPHDALSPNPNTDWRHTPFVLRWLQLGSVYSDDSLLLMSVPEAASQGLKRTVCPTI